MRQLSDGGDQGAEACPGLCPIAPHERFTVASCATLMLVAGATYLLSLGALRVRGSRGSAGLKANSTG